MNCKIMKQVIFLSFLLLSIITFAQNDVLDCWKTIRQQIEKDNNLMDMQQWMNCVKGKKIPEFKAVSISGDSIDTKNLRGKVVIINFWFIECHPCIAELPALNKLVKEYKNKEVVFLAPTYETKARLDTAFFPKYKFDFTIIADAQKIRGLFGETGYPTTYIIDKTGKIKQTYLGGIEGKKAEEEMYVETKPIIDELLNEK